MLDIKLDTLLVVYEEKSFSKAAEKLALTQPAVSNHISMLEKQLNIKLCQRKKGCIVFTPQGEVAVNYAKQLKEIYNKMCSEITNNEKAIVNIRIGITHSMENNSKVIKAIGEYLAFNKGVNITILAHSMKTLYKALESYEIDFIIGEEKPDDSRFSYRVLDMDSLVCIVCNNNPLSKRKSITVSELKEERMIMCLKHSATKVLFEAMLKDIGENIDNFNIIMKVDNTSTIKSLVRNDVGVSVIPKSNCLQDLKRKEYTGLIIENAKTSSEATVVFRKDFKYKNILDEFFTIYEDIADTE